MTLGIMQPYFLPYIGYLALIKHTDVFVLLDDVQYIRHGWINRNRVLHPDTGWQYVKVPLAKHGREARIRDVEIANDQKWRQRLLGQLGHYMKIARFFDDTMAVVESAISRETDSVVELNRSTLRAVCDYLGIGTEIVVFSESGVRIAEPGAPGDWALLISEAWLGSGPRAYWNPVRGRDLFDRGKYEDKGVDLKFFEMEIPEYDQGGRVFESRLSVVDAMMFNDADTINEMLDRYSLEV